MRRFLVVSAVAVAAIASTATAFVAPSGASTTPYCGIRWGSLAKQATAYTAAPITNVRSGRHDCFDRLVVDLAGAAGGYRVEYVAQVVEDGSGEPVALAGGAFLNVVVHAPAYGADGPTYEPADPAHVVNVAGYRTFRQVAWAGSFEGQTTLGLGVRARLPFRVFRLSGPGSGSRVVIDVAHRW
jgi:hypothetical protein